MFFSAFEEMHISLLCDYWYRAFHTASLCMYEYNGVLTGCLSNNQKSDGVNLWLLGRELQQSQSELLNSQSSVHTCMCPGVIMEVQYFGHFPLWSNLTKASIQTSFCFNTMAKVQCCPHRREVLQERGLYHSKRLYVGLFPLILPSWIFYSWAKLCIVISHVATWILVQSGWCCFYHPRQFAMLFPFFLCYVGVTVQRKVCTLPLSVPLSICGAQWAQASGYQPFSITAYTLGYDGAEFVSCYQFIPADIVRLYCNALVATSYFIKKLCCSWYRFFNAPYK